MPKDKVKAPRKVKESNKMVDKTVELTSEYAFLSDCLKRMKTIKKPSPAFKKLRDAVAVECTFAKSQLKINAQYEKEEKRAAKQLEKDKIRNLKKIVKTSKRK